MQFQDLRKGQRKAPACIWLVPCSRFGRSEAGQRAKQRCHSLELRCCLIEMSTVCAHPIVSRSRPTSSAAAQGPTSVSPLVSFTRGEHRVNAERLPAAPLNIPHFDFSRRLLPFAHLSNTSSCLFGDRRFLV